jgi:hypothetical protein
VNSTTQAKRQTLSKKLRFEIFKRDSFTCQYCGAQPPQVVLEVDHIRPVAEGGGNEQENLITACDKCNRGKGKRTLGDRIVRPDADLMWLKTQQEIAELKRYQKAKRQKDKLLAGAVDSLIEYWYNISGLSWAPSEPLVRRLLANNAPEVVEKAFTVVGPKIKSGRLRYDNEWKPYLFAVCRNMTNGIDPSEVAAKTKEAQQQIAALEEHERCLRSFIYLLLMEHDEEAFNFEQCEYASIYRNLETGVASIVWTSPDEGNNWTIRVRYRESDG